MSHTWIAIQITIHRLLAAVVYAWRQSLNRSQIEYRPNLLQLMYFISYRREKKSCEKMKHLKFKLKKKKWKNLNLKLGTSHNCSLRMRAMVIAIAAIKSFMVVWLLCLTFCGWIDKLFWFFLKKKKTNKLWFILLVFAELNSFTWNSRPNRDEFTTYFRFSLVYFLFLWLLLCVRLWYKLHIPTQTLSSMFDKICVFWSERHSRETKTTSWPFRRVWHQFSIIIHCD